MNRSPEQGKKKPELLSPAGSVDAFYGAVSAGADAVYFGASDYSARAHAENFTAEQIIDAITYASVMGVSTHLTVNTLMREAELEALPAFLAPFVEAGLDAVLVQDFGALHLIRERFPDLSIHASTQMAVTGVYGARLLKQFGVSRVVPARELSLGELSAMRKEADIEVEAFVHGAMCYCYSGMCLFSGMIGGRSGNRGRCAQACRMPYHTEKGSGESYLLSMRDLCTLPDLPALIDAGMDAFKIEGRMKKPAYAAGVTAVYRKYIDAYCADPSSFTVEEADLQTLSMLYQRSRAHTGYLHRHGGRDMITMDDGAYQKTDEALLNSLEEQYVRHRKRRPVSMRCELRKGLPARLILSASDVRVETEGILVREAKNSPLTEEAVKRQMTKLGDSFYRAADCMVHMDENIFVPLGALNALRREACEALTKALCFKRKAA